MAKFDFKSAGISAQEIGAVGPVEAQPFGRNACVIGTSEKGPAFVPLTLGSMNDFISKFGVVDGTKFGPLAVEEWMKNANSITYLRILGCGDGTPRSSSGEVARAGFTVGSELPGDDGYITASSYANFGGPLGRTYFLGCFMSESDGSNFFSSAGLQGDQNDNGLGVQSAVPIIRGMLMAPSGVILRLSASGGGGNNSAPPESLVADEITSHGCSLGSAVLKRDASYVQEFVMLLNGHKHTTTSPNFITASFDIASPIYFANVFNTTASLIQQKGHYLASHWDIYPAYATLTGTNVVANGADLDDTADRSYGTERSVFILTSSLSRDVGSSTVPNYESFRDRFSHASTPWFISQKFHNEPINLFRLHALDAGSSFSKKYKVTLHDIEPLPLDDQYGYGSFSLSIRDMYDPETSESSPLETFIDLNLDPTSDRYISKVIGDLNVYYDFDRPPEEQRIVIEGNYPLKSRYVRVEVSNVVSDRSLYSSALPIGVRGIPHLVTSGSSPLASLHSNDASALLDQNFLRNSTVPPIPMRRNNTTSNTTNTPPTNRPWGALFYHASPSDSNNVFQRDLSFESFSAYAPTMATDRLNVSAGNNTGAADTIENGIIDADRYCRNIFTLENLKILTGSNGTVDPPANWNEAQYVRRGSIADDPVTKTRAVTINDFRYQSNRDYLKFNTFFVGGYDGLNIFNSDDASLNNYSVRADFTDSNRGGLSGPCISSYMKSIDIVKNVTNVDAAVLAIPGIREQAVIERASDAAEERFDMLYVMDIPQVDESSSQIDMSSLNNLPSTKLTAQSFSSLGINSSFAAAYFPDVVIRTDSVPNVDLTVPPSVVVLGALSRNDTLAAPWYAPAGLTRGLLISTIQPIVTLDEPSLNLLYSNRINPLYPTTDIQGATVPSGVVVWGQKTLFNSQTALSRIANRRLLLEIRRQIRSIAVQLLFEQNTQAIVNRFITLTSSYLSGIKSSGGMQDFKVEISPTSGYELQSLSGKIYIKPNKTLEFVSLDFILTNGLQSEI